MPIIIVSCKMLVKIANFDKLVMLLTGIYSIIAPYL